MKAFVKDGIYIPIKYVDETAERRIKKRFEKDSYVKEAVCEKCEWFGERPNDICDRCPNYGGKITMFKEVEINDKTYLRTPFGDKASLEKIFGEIDFIDRTDDCPMQGKFEFTGTLYDYQKPAVKAMLKTTGGVLKSAPRTGKCLTGETLVMTSKGLTNLKRVCSPSPGYTKANFKILTEKGWKSVVETYTEIVDTTIRVTTENGWTLRGTPEHPLLVLTEDLNFHWRRLSDLKVGDRVCVSKWFDIPAHVESDMTPDLAAFMGYCVANGNLNVAKYGRFDISSKNTKVLQDVLRISKKLFPEVAPKVKTHKDTRGTPSVSFNSRGLIKYLTERGLKMVKSKDKDVPAPVVTAGSECVQSFLSAYLSCDSYIPRAEIELCSASKKLMRQVQFLLLSFGVFSKFSSGTGYARNGSGTVRSYYHLWIGARSKACFLDAFTLKKDVSGTSKTYRSGRGDTVPYAGMHLRELSDKTRVPGKYNLYRKGNKIVKLVGSAEMFSRRKSMPDHITIDRLESINTKSVKVLDAELANKLNRIKDTKFSFETVTRVTEKKGDVKVYDVVVPETESFLANGVVSHNTVMSTYVIAKLKQKTVILASQKDWLDNFYETFVGSDEQEPVTNIKKKRIGFPKTLKECEKFDVCLFTYQKFLKPKGKKLLKKIRKMFGVMVVDEVQYASAPEFAQVINSFVCRRKYGLSGTPERKDMKHWIAAKLVGKVFFETTAERWVPSIECTPTSLGGKMPKNWVYMVRKIESDPERCKLIAKTALADVAKGHMVLIPFARVEVIKAVTLAINRMAREPIAESFYGKTKNRKDLIQRARKYETKVIVGNLRLLSTGINIPRASALYEVTPSSNIPKAEQRFSRILTPYEGKPMPLIRYFLDDVDVRRNCLRNEFFKCLWPMFRPKMSVPQKEMVFAYMGNKKKHRSVNAMSAVQFKELR